MIEILVDVTRHAVAWRVIVTKTFHGSFDAQDVIGLVLFAVAHRREQTAEEVAERTRGHVFAP
jgi:hypothetical protein